MFESIHTAVAGTNASSDMLLVNHKATRLFNCSMAGDELSDDMYRTVDGFKDDMYLARR